MPAGKVARSSRADRSEVERERVEVGLVKLGVLDMEDWVSSTGASRCQAECLGADRSASGSSLVAEKRRVETPVDSALRDDGRRRSEGEVGAGRGKLRAKRSGLAGGAWSRSEKTRRWRE